MSKMFYHVAQDNTGNLLFGVSGTMRIAGTGTVATIYGDEALTVPIPNPMTNHPSFGSFKCFLGVGDYDFYMAKAGYTFETLTGVQGSGSMADQNASAIAITGGSATGLTTVGTQVLAIPDAVAPVANFRMSVRWLHAAPGGLVFLVTDSDTGAFPPISFLNVSGATVGTITQTASATAYNTTSDSRLKDAITPLEGALDVVRALNPVAFRWRLDGSQGRGFLAHEVQEVIPDGVITGEKDAVDDEGNVVPQQIDYSKLVPWLVSAVKELTQQVEMLQAQLAEAGA